MAERRHRVEELFHDALQRDPGERPSFLSEACASDPDLRAEVESLISAQERPGNFLDEPALGSPARLIAAMPPKPVEYRRHPFLGVVGLATLIIAGLFAYGAVLLVQNGGASASFGWSEARRGDEWFVSQVDPAGPAAGLLEPGDRIIEMSALPPFSPVGTAPHRRELSPGETYEIKVERAGVARTIYVGVASGPSVLATQITYFASSLLWCAIGLWIGAARPERPVARLAAVTCIVSGLILLTTGVLHGEAFWVPLHMVLGYHFFARFPSDDVPRGSTKAFLYLLYLVYAASLVLRAPFPGSYLARFAGAIRFPVLHTVGYGLFLLVFTGSAIAMMAVSAHNYRRLTTEDQRRRVRWVIFASLVALAPQVWYGAIGMLTRSAGPAPGSPAALILNIVPVAIPLSIALAVIKHRILDITVAIRLGIKYGLARRALQVLVVLPIIALVYSFVRNRHQTLAEIATQNTAYVYWLVAAGLSLRFRKPIQRWLDRRFFREEYDREQLLLGLVDEVGRIDSIPSLTRLVTDKIQAALHPKATYFWYRDSDESAIASSSDPQLTPPDFPGGAWLSWLAEQNQAIDLPLPAASGITEAEVRWLDARQVRLAIPVSDSGDRLVAVLLLGEKKSEQPYSAVDRRLLYAVAKQTAATRENLSLRAIVTEEQRIRHDVLSRLDAQLPDLLKECPRCGACFSGKTDVCSADGARLTLPMPVLRIVDHKYRLDRLIGRGGMGAVYEAGDLQLGRTVAVKILLGRAFGDINAVRRFHREARAVARLNHPNIVSVYDFGPLEGEGAYLVMERINGITLRAVLERDGVLTPEQAADWFAQLLDGTAAAHAAGVVHRDLKPENVIGHQVGTPTFTVKILDFGLAKIHSVEAAVSGTLTAVGTIVGTLGYMSPEQVLGGEVDHRADLFAVGVMLAEALTGRRPFQGENWGELSRAVLHAAYHLPTTTPEGAMLDAVLQRCIAKEAPERIESAAELRRELIPALRNCPCI